MRADILEQAKALRASMDAAAAVLTDEQAVKAPMIYRPWSSDSVAYAVGDRCLYGGVLYKCLQGHTSQETWTPDKTPALWAVIEAVHTGTRDDPVTAARGMEYVYGLYYEDPEDGKLYRCTRTGEAEGGKVTLQYLPHELMGQYFVEVS